jgi:signal transduction histidine kinase
MDNEATPDLRLRALVHDLNNVLQTITHAAELISPSPENAPVASIIARAADQARRIIAGAMEPECPVCVRPIALSAAQFVRDFSVVSGGPVISFAIDVSESMHVHIAPAALERAFVNLFLNALDAARRSGQSVRIDVRGSCDGDHAVIVVRDDGPGVPGAALAQVFHGDYSGTGRGLGLHIVRDVITAAGGAVNAANRTDGHGAEFTLRLPAAAMAATV